MVKTKLTKTEFEALGGTIQVSDIFLPDGDSYVAKLDSVDGLEVANVHGLRTALQKERQNVSERDALLRQFDNLDANAVQTLTAERDKLKTELEEARKGGGGKGTEQLEAQHAARLKELTEAHEADKTKATDREGVLLGEIGRLLIDSQASIIMADKDVGGNPTLLLPHIRTQAKVVEKDGKFRTIVVDPATGGARVSQTKSDGSDMDLRELILAMKGQDTFAPAFAGTNARGSGGAGGDAGSGSGSGGQHVISSQDAMDPAKYAAAKEAATKAGSELVISGLPPVPGEVSGGQ